jgi:hypothetical protein
LAGLTIEYNSQREHPKESTTGERAHRFSFS